MCTKHHSPHPHIEVNSPTAGTETHAEENTYTGELYEGRCGSNHSSVSLPTSTSPLAKVAIFLILFYQTMISPYTPPACRYRPTCSSYTKEAIRKYGFFKGGWMGFWRILRCNPFCKGGYDPVP